MAYEVVMSYHLHMPSYFLGTFTEYPFLMSQIPHPTEWNYSSCETDKYPFARYPV